MAAELAACKGEVAHLTKERQDLYASTSWRMTAPLRDAKALVSWTLKKLRAAVIGAIVCINAVGLQHRLDSK